MEEKRMVIIGVGAVLVIMTITLLAVTLPANEDTSEPNIEVNETYPLLLISLDGFRFDYISRNIPSLETLANEGVRASFMMPVYPTLTFPNHYSIVTGLYPESHGIVNNAFYDPDFEESFSMSTESGRFWGGEPIWNTLTLQNKISATYFWPGSDRNISGMYPTYYFPYDTDTTYDTRVNQVLDWLSMPVEKRPHFVTLYFDEPDHTGHEFGPDTREVDLQVEYMDGVISRLLMGLRTRELEDKVNIVVLADHGMARSKSKEEALNLTSYVTDLMTISANNTFGAFTTLRLKDKANVVDVMNKLSCPSGETSMRAYTPQDLPRRIHYSNNKRIGDIVLDVDSGSFTADPNHPEYLENPLLGHHGYDNHITTMGALFIAKGPDFKNNTVLEPFQNIELYNLFCLLTDVDPAPNNGTEGALYAALRYPPSYPEIPGAEQDHPPNAEFPTTITPELIHLAECTGDASNVTEEWLLETKFDSTEQADLEKTHLPWGIPLSGNDSDILLLHHTDHVTGYSSKLKLPLWTSFTVDQLVEWTPVDQSLWSSDVRLNASTTPSCKSYDELTEFEKFPLFYPAFSIESERTPYLVSNAVPLLSTNKLKEIMNLVVDEWGSDRIDFNLLIGVAFDYDANSLPDEIINKTPVAVPSHFFIVATGCKQLQSVSECNVKDLDAKSFIFPQNQTVSNDCLMGEDYGSFHLSTVRDVELLSGLSFFPGLKDPEKRLQLILRIHTNIYS